MDISPHKQTTAGYIKSGSYDKNSAGDILIFGSNIMVFTSSSLPVVVVVVFELKERVCCFAYV